MTVYAAPGDWPDARCLHPAAPPMEIPGELPPGPKRDHQIARRRTICHQCPHLDPCRQWALTTPDPAGAAIAGGMTPGERDKARKAAGGIPAQRGIPSAVRDHGSLAGYRRHLRAGEKACQACLDANAAYKRNTRPSQAKRTA